MIPKSCCQPRPHDHPGRTSRRARRPACYPTRGDTIEGLRIYLVLNAYWEPLAFELPDGHWCRWIDTTLPSPEDIVPWQDAPAVTQQRYPVGPRSVVVLFEPTGDGRGDRRDELRPEDDRGSSSAGAMTPSGTI